MVVAVSRTTAGVVVRRLIPTVIALPILLGWIQLLGLRAGAYEISAGTALFVLANVLGFGAVILVGGAFLHRAELARHASARHEAELHSENRRVAEVSRMKSQFLANMSHEMRTPLNAVIGFGALVHEEKAGPINDEQREYLGDVVSSAKHLLQLVEDVLDLARLEAGRMEPRLVRVDPSTIAAEVIDVLRPIATAKRVAIHYQADVRIPSVATDPRMLRQILWNYLSNAV
jgi:signal transduction histidine kinase